MVHGTVESSREKAPSGARIKLTVTPDPGYALESLTVTDSRGNSISLTNSGSGAYTFTMPARKVTVSASFAATGGDADANGYANCPKDHTCPIWPFTDAQTTAWYHDGVHYCLDAGLMVGYGNNIFKPSADTSRAMIVTMLWRLENEPATQFPITFEDVKPNAWYADAVRWAASVGVVEGYNALTFGPNDPVTREQMAAILYRYARHKGYDVSESASLLSFPDAETVGKWAVPAMQWACGSGMIEGTRDKDGTVLLDPKGSTTRAQMATMLMRFCAEIVK